MDPAKEPGDAAQLKREVSCPATALRPHQSPRVPRRLAGGGWVPPDGTGPPGHSPSTRAAHSARSSRSSAADRSLMLAGAPRRGSRARGGRPRVLAAAESPRLCSRPPGSARFRCARRWVPGASLRPAPGPRSQHSLPPPAQASFKSAPALAASELISMQNHAVTHWISHRGGGRRPSPPAPTAIAAAYTRREPRVHTRTQLIPSGTHPCAPSHTCTPRPGTRAHSKCPWLPQ